MPNARPRLCEACRFWERLGEHSPRGLCRRNAPTDVTGGVWPVTRTGDWCGEYSPVSGEGSDDAQR